jgi:enamine deaminase RidA (YjgF/YER057c/UK114 family)
MRSFVPFESLWAMPIEVPYSFLVRDCNSAWTCGQLALNENSEIIAPGDLTAQSEVVCDYIETILPDAKLEKPSLRRLLLYYIHRNDNSRDAMVAIFRKRFGDHVLLDPIPVPHYYYEGVELEVDVFCDVEPGAMRSIVEDSSAITIRGETQLFVSLWTDNLDLDQAYAHVAEAVGPEFICMNEHWFLPEDCKAKRKDHPDPGSLLSAGPSQTKTLGLFTFVQKTDPVRDDVTTVNEVTLVFRTCGGRSWLQARCLDGDLGLVEQTDRIMREIEGTLKKQRLSFSDVVKSTTHYVGGSANELHDNMQVRNKYYRKPGPASTGLPVFGFQDRNSRVVVDLTLIKAG